MVPLDDELTQLDWLARRRPALVLVARSGLGTLNHTLLSLEALRQRHLEPRALFLVGPPHAANRATLAARSGVARLFEVPRFERLDPAALDAWLDEHDLDGVLGA
jgi:dethiobiotin synthetase